MPLKFIASAAIGFIGLTLAIGYFGLSTSISNVRDKNETESVQKEEGSRLVLPDIVFPKIPLEEKEAPQPTPTPAPVPVSPAPTPVPAATTPITPAPVAEAPQSAFVNIICSPKDSPLKKSISGSGVIIDSRGIILTVAHVGHYFLLENYPERGNADCFIRTGSPAKTAYDAELIFVSPQWVEENAGILAKSSVRGNGQNDFALLAITKSKTSASLPRSFPFIPLSSSNPQAGDEVTIGSYGAEFLSGNEIKTALYPISDEGEIEGIFTYGQNKADVISVHGTDAAQSGSSGGGVVNEDGKLAGLISISSLSGGTSERTLYAITPNHIRASFKETTGKNLDSYLRGGLSSLVEDFEDEVADLAEIVWDAIF